MEEVELPDPDEVPRRVRELGLTVELLLDAVRRGQNAADFCTASHPRTYPGSAAWGETVAGLREATALSGWTNSDEENIPRTTSPDRQVTVTAVSGDHRTGLRSDHPAQTRRPRGAAGRRIVRRNAQLVLQELLPDDASTSDDGEAVRLGPMWYLLYFRDQDTIRSELSFAVGVSSEGALLEWKERLVLPEIDLLDDLRAAGGRDDDLVPDVDVSVERRAS